MLARWGDRKEILSRGFVPVARTFLLFAAHLRPDGVTPAEAMFVLQLMVHKWDERSPYPSYERLAVRMGVSTVYVRKLARTLDGKGFLKRTRVRGRTTMTFDLQPLFDRLAQHIRIHGSNEPRPGNPDQGSVGRAT